MKPLKLKVCGMKDADNIDEMVALQPDFIGFIFYEKSPRFVGKKDIPALYSIPASIRKVGVFVNEKPENIYAWADRYALDYVQLHGDEDARFAAALKARGLGVIKAVRVIDRLPAGMEEYTDKVDYFLFDTLTSQYGGSGSCFDWSLLESYTLKTPFMLSGGIGLDEAKKILSRPHPHMEAIDVNSRFETTPGIKDIRQIKMLKNLLCAPIT